MASSSSPFANAGKVQVLPTSTALLFTPTTNNNLTINNIGHPTQNIRPTTNLSNGTYIQQQSLTSPTSIVRLNQPNQFTSQTVWTNNSTQLSPKIQYSPTTKNEPSTPTSFQTLQLPTHQQQQTSILPTKLVAQPVVRQTVTAQQAPKFTESQINDLVAKCRTFLTTLLKLAEKQAPEKLPMVRSCIQDLLDGTIDPESFTQRLHTLYKSQPHTSLVPFFKLALPHMRQIVQRTFGRPITIELLEKLNLPSSKPPSTTTTATTPTTTTPSRVVVNPSLLTQQSTSLVQQPLLYTTVQPQQKINLLQQTPQQTLIASTPSLLGQQQQQQQQARAQISITGIRPIVATVSPTSNTNLLTGQQTHTIQPVTQTILQQSDSLLQRTFLSPTTPTTTLQQPQIITVSHQPIRTDIRTNTSQPSLTNISSLSQPQIQIQQRTILKHEDESSDDVLGNNGLLTTSSGPIDDRHTRHITHDKRLLPAISLRRRLDHLVKHDKRWEGGNMVLYDDSVCALISHALEERLKNFIEQIKSISQQRINLSIDVHPNNEEEEQEIDEKGRKRKFEEDINSYKQLSKKFRDIKSKTIKEKYQTNLQDLILLMEQDKQLKRSTILIKALDKLSSSSSSSS